MKTWCFPSSDLVLVKKSGTIVLCGLIPCLPLPIDDVLVLLFSCSLVLASLRTYLYCTLAVHWERETRKELQKGSFHFFLLWVSVEGGTRNRPQGSDGSASFQKAEATFDDSASLPLPYCTRSWRDGSRSYKQACVLWCVPSPLCAICWVSVLCHHEPSQSR